MTEESISQATASAGGPRDGSTAAAEPTRRRFGGDDGHLDDADIVVDSPVPDWCNLGVTLRIVIGVNLLFFAVAAVQAPTFAAWLAQWLRLAMLVEPVVIASLLLGCLVRRTTWQLPKQAQYAFAIALPAVVTMVVDWILEPTYHESSAIVWRDALLGAALGATALYWAKLRERAYSPALAEAQLQALQSRIRPHFLFNSLNAALGMIRSDPRRAETVLEDISDLFRVLMRDSRERVPLDNEVSLCKQYLAIEKLRLGDRLRTEWRIDENALHALVPTLLLQPLVENAVHHGIEPAPEGGEITIDVVRTGRNIDITIANPWQGSAAAQQTRGNRIGLDNVRRRLALVHDLEASIDSNVRDGRYVVDIRLPAERRRSPRGMKPA